MRTRHATLVEVLCDLENSDQGIVFIGRNEETFISYREMYSQAKRRLAALRLKGMRQKDELVFQVEDNKEFIALFWACQLGGIVPVPLTSSHNEEHKRKLARVWTLLNNPYLACEKDTLQQIEKYEHVPEIAVCSASMRERAICVWDEELLREVDYESIQVLVKPEDTAVIQFSSGSTGEPKGVVLSHGNIMSNIEAILDGASVTADDVSLSWMPLTHDMGLIGCHLAALTAGIRQYLMPPSVFMMDPEIWLAKAHEHRVSLLSSPNFGYKHFLAHHAPERIAEWDLSRVRLVFNGAEPISAELCDRFLDAIAPAGAGRNILFPVYGMAEASLAVTFPPVDEEVIPVHAVRSRLAIGQPIQELPEASEDSVTFVDVGYPVKSCEVRITGDDGVSMKDRCIGNIMIRGTNVTKGYYGREGEGPIDADGWLDTGDVGFMRDGRLVVTGRRKDIVFVRGQNFYPHDLEEIAQTKLNLQHGKIAFCSVSDRQSGSEELVAFVVHRGKAESFAATVGNVKKALSQAAGIEVRYVVPVKNIPRTTSGKLQRYKLAESFERGEFTTTLEQLRELADERPHALDPSIPASSLDGRLHASWAKVLGTETFGVDDDFFELGGDSLKSAMLLNRIRKDLQVNMEPAELIDVSTIRKLAAYMRGKETGTYAPIEKAAVQKHYPLSSSQYRVYAQEQAQDIGLSYHMPFVLRIRAKVDFERVENVLRALIVKHESLRTSIEEIDGEPVQMVHPEAETAFELVRIPHNAGGTEAAIESFIRPFQLHEAPLFRAGYISEAAGGEEDEEKHILVFDMHHIISDGISAQKIIEQFIATYEGEAQEPGEGALQYKDFVMWQRSGGESTARNRGADYWKRRLAGDLPLLEMPTDRPRSETRSFAGDVVRFSLARTDAERLHELARGLSVSANAILLTAYAAVLRVYTGQEEVVVGTVDAGRTDADLEEVVGMFIRYLPLRLKLDPSLTFKETILRQARAIAEDYAHGDFPYEDMLELAENATPQGRNPLFDTMLILHNQMDIGATRRFGTGSLTFEERRTGTSKLDFKLDVYKDSDAYSCWLEYNSRLFDRETMERLGRHFATIVEAMLVDPESRVGDVEMLTAQERATLLGEFNPAESLDALQDRTLNDWFDEAVRRWPDRIALIAGERAMTYRALNDRADRLAAALRIRGLGPDRIAAVVAERSEAMIVAILAIWKAGGAYLPLAPDLPGDRIRYALADSGALIVLAESRYVHLFEAATDGAGNKGADTFDGDILAIEDESLYAHAQSDRASVSSGHLAYIIYTSGSTGNPKGVMTEHGAAVNRIRWMQKQYPIGQDDVILQKTTFTFDVSVWELTWWFFAGATVCLLAPGGEKDPAIIARTIEKHRITTLHFVPSMLHLFLAHYENGGASDGEGPLPSLNTLKYAFASGEALTPQHVERFYRVINRAGGHAMLANLYGPTEAAIDVSYFDCPSDGSPDVVPIGKPIDNIRLYVLDERRRLVPVGVPGELHIAGKGLARGYIGNPALTADKFVDDPFVPGERMYKTGDLAKWRADGNIVYMGRLDHQVKLRGYRIELGEIEHAMLSHPDISEAVVMVAPASSEGESELKAILVCGQALTETDIRGHLRGRLPAYMIPSRFGRVEAMPLTSSGKIDRKRLDRYVDEVVPLQQTELEAPRDEIEERLLVLWRAVLRRERIGVTDHFFEIGGHSLQATELLNKLHKELGHKLRLKHIFERPTIRGLAEIIRGHEAEDFDPLPELPEHTRGALSSAQSRLLILEQFEGIGTAYHLPIVFEHKGEVDESQFEHAIRAVVDRHESLRMSFAMKDGVPELTVHPKREVAIERLQGTREQLSAIVRAFVRPFDLSGETLIRAAIVQLSNREQLILFDMHHLVSDGVSLGILADDFVQYYEGREPDQEVAPYRSFVEWQRLKLAGGKWQEQMSYWLGQFADGVPTLSMPTDFDRPSMRSFEGGSVTFRLTEDETRALRGWAADAGLTTYMAMLAVFNVFLSRYAGQEDIVVGTPVSGRSHAELANVVGMFVNTLAIRNKPSASKTFKAFAQEVRDRAICAFDHPDYPFEELVGKLQTTRSLDRNPLFDAVFVMQNMTIPEMLLDGQPLKRLDPEYVSAKFDLTLEAIETDSAIDCRFEYCSRLFREETVVRWTRHFRNILQAVATDPDIAIGQIELLAEDEITELLADPNGATEYPRHHTVHGLFEEQAARTPDRIAVVCGDRRLTYKELDERANRFAALLRREGVAPDQRVGMMLERSVDMIVGMLAILKAGGAYVPMDPELPADRTAFMIEDSATTIVLTETKHADKLRAIVPTVLDMQQVALHEELSAPLTNVNAPGDLAYIIYTSGTTGKPKGVMIEHRNVVRLLIHDRPLFDFGELDAWTMFHSYGFDFSVWEMYGALLTGGKLVVLEKRTAQDPERLLDVLIEEEVTVFNQTPSAFYHFMRYESARQDAKLRLRYVIFGGEALKPAMLKAWKQRYPSTKLVNMYGITETTVHVTYKEIGDEEIASNRSRIGRAIPTLTALVMDAGGKLAPIGVPGELYIGGDGVARGYMNRESLTAERFVPNPYRPSEKLYRSGDLAFLSTDGELTYLGRIDHQVKLRGYRIELGEIEHALQSIPQLFEAAVLLKEGASGEKELWAYIAANDTLRTSDIRQRLAATLPEYMIPTVYVPLTALPLTGNGKVDRAALLRLEPERRTSGPASGSASEAPQSELEQALGEMWRELLGVGEVGVTDNFFEVGGHSLLLLRLHGLIEARYPGAMKVTDLFAYPTIRAQAAFLEKAIEPQSVEANAALRHAELPESFFARRPGPTVRETLRFRLDERVTAAANRLAEEAGVTIEPVLAAAYAHLLAQLTKQPDQTVYVRGGDRMLRVAEVDLQAFADALSLIRGMDGKLSSSGLPEKLILPPAPPNGIYPLLLKDGRSNSGPGASAESAFDVVLRFKEESGGLTLHCEFDENKLRKDRMRVWCQGYAKICEWLLGAYMDSRQVAAGNEGATHE